MLNAMASAHAAQRAAARAAARVGRCGAAQAQSERAQMNVQAFLDALAEALSREAGSVSLDDTPDTLEEWDSMGHLTILSTIESELGIAPDTEELMNFTSIRQLVDVLKARGALED